MTITNNRKRQNQTRQIRGQCRNDIYKNMLIE